MAPLGSLLRAGGLAAALLPFNSLAAPNPPVVADLVFRNGSIYTLNERGSKASALAVKDGVISHVGTDRCVESHIGEKTRIVDLQGHMVMPGLIDSHMHILSGGLFLLKCDLAYQSLPLEAILEHVQGCIDDEAQAGDDTWLEVVNMDYPGLVERSGPVGKLQLDRLSTKRPVMIRSSDYHTVLANSRALDLSNINSETEDPANGKIERLPGSREPSGVLQDDAWGLLAGPPPPSEEDNLNAGRAALKLLREAGITTFQEAAAGEEHHAIFDAIRKEGGLSARGYFDYRIEAPKSVDEVEDLVSHVVGTLKGLHDDSSKLGPEPTLKWQAIKAFIDGVITYPSSTAALIEPYWLPKTDAVTNQTTWSPDPTTLKDPYWQPEVLTKTLELLFLSKIDAQLHTDGDLSVRIALDAAESFRNKYPKKDFRLGLAHDELSHQDDWARFAELGVDAIMSFQWAQLSSFYIPSTFLSLAEYRHGNLQSYAKIEEAGRPVVYGSDWPIDPLDEFLALRVGVTRKGDPQNPNSPASQGPPFDGVFPGSGISREAALKAITINGARFLRADKDIGSLERGKLADLIILDSDFFEVSDEELGRQKVLVTVLGGEAVFVADGAEYFGLTPKFPNGDEHSQRLSRRSVGGFASKGMSQESKMAAAKLRRRGECVHK